MMSFSPPQLAEFFESKKRAQQPAAQARIELVASNVCNEPTRIIDRHTDRAAALEGKTVGTMTSAELGQALRRHGFQHL